MLQTRTRNLSGEIEWYTPWRYLAAVREVMGGIDLDPASSKAAQLHVRATDYYSIERSGLAHPWWGRVWLNPPYAMPLIKQFVVRMTEAAQTGEISEGILLTNSATDTEWSHLIWDAAQAVCFTRGRIRFLEAKGEELIERPAPMMGQMFSYFGIHSERFAQIFSKFGRVFLTT